MVFKYDEKSGNSVFFGIFGDQVELNDALVMEVNMMPNKHNIIVIQSPLVSDFVSLVKNLNNGSTSKEEIENFQNKLEEIKTKL